MEVDRASEEEWISTKRGRPAGDDLLAQTEQVVVAGITSHCEQQ